MDALEEMMLRLKQTSTKSCSSEHTEKACPECQICGGSGWEMYYEDGMCFARECSCGIRQKEISSRRSSFAMLPEAFRAVSRQNFDSSVYLTSQGKEKAHISLKIIDKWFELFDDMRERGMGLYIHSNTKGSGKTRMAASIANELMETKNMQVRFCTSLQILNAIKESWDNNSGGEGRLLDTLCTTEVLIIDDFGTEQSDKAWINERFYHIINSRYIDKKITIYTSNSKLEGLMYDDRITNRIKERSFNVPFPEESVREIIAKKNAEELAKMIRS